MLFLGVQNTLDMERKQLDDKCWPLLLYSECVGKTLGEKNS